MRPAKINFSVVSVVFALLSPIVFAQKPATISTAGTASVAGRISVDGGALAGIQVLLQREAEGIAVLNQTPPLKAATDTDGNFRFTKVAAGKYRLQIYAPVYVKEQKDNSYHAGQAINVAADENIENLNFSLRRGGVITGNVTDDENRPLIEEAVKLIRVDAQGKRINEPVRPAFLSLNRTDDRGVYRLFGLEPGRYLVAVGSDRNEVALFGLPKDFQLTYHPNTVNEAEARVVEVAPGTEVEGVNIVMKNADTKKGFTLSGRVVEADTGKPVAGMMITHASNAKGDDRPPVSFGMTPSTTNSLGEFRLEGLNAGSYSISMMNPQQMLGTGLEFYGESREIEITGADVTGLELKVFKGATISGKVVLEGSQDPKLLSWLSGSMLQAMPELDYTKPNYMQSVMSSLAMGPVSPDGSFKISGLRPGKFRLGLMNPAEPKLKLVRVEQNGTPTPFVEVASAQPVAGIRLVLAYGTATLTGRVEVRGGALQTGTSFSIRATTKGAGNDNMTVNAETDARGQFISEGIVPGVYEVSVWRIKTPKNDSVKSQNVSQTVVLADNARQEVVLVVDLTDKEK
jgi:protocatechuate 3,4-dioxygenase beta subunit